MITPNKVRACFMLGLMASSVQATPVPSTDHIRVAANSDGSYEAYFERFSWRFAGKISLGANDITQSAGIDTVGAYHEVRFAGSDGNRYSLRAYPERSAVLFSVTTDREVPNKSPFPILNEYPKDLHRMSYDGNFAVFTFKKLASDSPWLFFDDATRSFILSPASDYMITQTEMNGSGNISTGLLSGISKIPEGHTHRTLLVADDGINKTFDTWGRTLTDLEGKVRPTNDAYVGLKYLGYWTDRGGGYYYDYESSKGYVGTLLAVRDEFQKMGIPLGYLQLDSWWYPKGILGDWSKAAILAGIRTFRASPKLFPDGLAAFRKELGLPLVVHSRWIDTFSPYRNRFKMSGNMSIDPGFWNEIMVSLKEAGVVTYEQDWLSSHAQTKWDISAPDDFMNQMAAASQAQELNMQYCMPLPRHYMQGVKYSNLFTIRTSNDRFESSKWKEFLFDSRLASALGEWPWSDVFMSSETMNLLLSNLSGGMVGVGDKLGDFDAANLRRTVRADGVIVKPDTSIVPLDSAYVNEAKNLNQALVSSAFTNDGPTRRAAYVFAYGDGSPASFKASDLGFTGSTYVYDYFGGHGYELPADQEFSTKAQRDGSYFVVSPIGRSRIALLGDLDKFVSLGKRRLTEVSDGESLRIKVAFADSETQVGISGYAPQQPRAIASIGKVEECSYDTTSRLFHCLVKPDANRTAELQLRGD